jgi:hypothetical protein
MGELATTVGMSAMWHDEAFPVFPKYSVIRRTMHVFIYISLIGHYSNS